MKIACMMHNFKTTPLEEVCGIIAELGYDTVEACALKEEYFPKATYKYVDIDARPEKQMKAIEKAGLSCPALSVHCEMIKDAESVPYLKKAARWAKDAGVPIIITGEGWKPESMAMETAFDRARSAIMEVLDECAKLGVHFAMEPHGTFTLKPEGLKQLMALSPSPYYFINYDVGNLSGGCGLPNAKLLPQFLARVEWVHIKDYAKKDDGKRQTVDIGAGDVDIAAAVKILKDAGYGGVMAVEILGHSDPVGSSGRALGYLRGLI